MFYISDEYKSIEDSLTKEKILEESKDALYDSIIKHDGIFCVLYGEIDDIGFIYNPELKKATHLFLHDEFDDYMYFIRKVKEMAFDDEKYPLQVIPFNPPIKEK